MLCEHCGNRLEGPYCGRCGAAAPSTPGRTGETSDPREPTHLASYRADAAGRSPGSSGGYPPYGYSSHPGYPEYPEGYPDSYSSMPPAYPAPGQSSGGMRKAILALAAAVVIAAVMLAVSRPWQSQESSEEAQANPTVTVTSSAAPAAAQQSAAQQSGGQQSGGQQAAPAPAASAQAPAPARSAAPAPAQPQSAAQRYRMYHQGSGIGGPFDKVATLHSTTSRPFMVDVATAYRDSGAAGGSVVLQDIYSVAAGRHVTMSCSPQGDATVLCTGGRNARVLLYN